VRACGLEPALFYDRTLGLPSIVPALDLIKLTRILVCASCPSGSTPVPSWHVNGRGRAGPATGSRLPGRRRMPGVKKLHQQSESSTKPEFHRRPPARQVARALPTGPLGQRICPCLGPLPHPRRPTVVFKPRKKKKKKKNKQKQKKTSEPFWTVDPAAWTPWN